MDVRIKSGTLKNFPWGNAQALTTIINQNSLPIYKESPYDTFQANLYSTTFGALTATITVQGSNDVWSGVGFVANNCTLTNGSAVITCTASQFAGGTEELNDLYNPPVAVGMSVIGNGIPVGSYVTVVTSNNSITISNNVAGLAISPSLNTVRFFQNNWVATSLGVITLSGTTVNTTPSLSDGFTTIAPWKFVRSVVSGLTGTGATVQVLMGD